MKKPIILSAILLSSLVYSAAEAQISVHIGFNVPARRVYVPAPQPVEVYDTDEYDDSDDYYYLPDVEAYYSVPTHRYFYMNEGSWVSAAYLPGAYRNYDWRNARRYEVRGRRPYMNHDIYRNKWGGNNNRGNWGRGNNNYAGRRSDYGNRNNTWNRPDNIWNRRDNNHSNYGQPNRGNNDRNRGNWGSNQPSRSNTGNWGSRDRGNQSRPQPQYQNNGGSRSNNNRGGGRIAQNQGRQGGDNHRGRF